MLVKRLAVRGDLLDLIADPGWHDTAPAAALRFARGADPRHQAGAAA